MPTNLTVADIQPGLINIKPVVSNVEPNMSDLPPALRIIAADVADAVKYSLTAVAANPGGAYRPESVEANFAGALKTIRSEASATVTKSAADVLKSTPDSLRAQFGRYAELPAEAVAKMGFERASEGLKDLTIDPKAFGLSTPVISAPVSIVRSTSEGLIIPRDVLPGNFEEFESLTAEATASARSTAVIDRDRFESVWGSISSHDPFEEVASGGEFEGQAVTDKLGIYLRMIKCEDETNPEWWGDDEIGLGGVSTDEDGDVKKIGERYIGGGFHDGKSKSYSNWLYHSFGLRERNFWPKKFSLTFVLAEKDWGGLASFLSNLWDRIKNKVHAALEAAARAAGVALATFLGVPEFGVLVGQAIAAALKWIFDVIIGWLIKLFKDDIFPPFTAWCTVPSMSARWYYPNGTWGNPWSPVLTARFNGFGGRYRLDYQWRLYA